MEIRTITVHCDADNCVRVGDLRTAGWTDLCPTHTAEREQQRLLLASAAETAARAAARAQDRRLADAIAAGRFVLTMSPETARVVAAALRDRIRMLRGYHQHAERVAALRDLLAQLEEPA